ncbi:MAG: hypothetical protein IJ131_02845 [Eggerthellaceae bacterium]|nr:hypothetical protein [Eggerthellaceae bacterium]
MPKIISSTELRNEYNAVSGWCHETGQAAYVTRNGSGDLAVMSVEAHDEREARLALYDFIEAGRKDRLAGRVTPARDVLAQLRDTLGAEDVQRASNA